ADRAGTSPMDVDIERTQGPAASLWLRGDARAGDGGVREELAQKLGGHPPPRSSSSPSRYFCLRECPICPMSINLTPYRIGGVANPRHCSGKFILAAANLLGPMANRACFVHINAS